MWDQIKTLPQYILPQHLLSRWMYRITRSRLPYWKDLIIRMFISHYKVDMQISEQTDAASFACFNEFFTRKLKSEARPVDAGALSIASPVDGRISQIGDILGDEMIQAKGRRFCLEALLANDDEHVARFKDGQYVTIYLAPRDYHRIHFPVAAKLIKMTYIPGELFSVNESTSRAVDQLFARNERLVCLFETNFGRMACILIGAMFVGNMETVWQGEITPAKAGQLPIWNYDSNSPGQTDFSKGEELGRFNMGSTVILLFEKGRMSWSDLVQVSDKVQMGQLVGTGNS